MRKRRKRKYVNRNSYVDTTLSILSRVMDSKGENEHLWDLTKDARPNTLYRLWERYVQA